MSLFEETRAQIHRKKKQLIQFHPFIFSITIPVNDRHSRKITTKPHLLPRKGVKRKRIRCDVHSTINPATVYVPASVNKHHRGFSFAEKKSGKGEKSHRFLCFGPRSRRPSLRRFRASLRASWQDRKPKKQTTY